jgi:hypothetical protein
MPHRDIWDIQEPSRRGVNGRPGRRPPATPLGLRGRHLWTRHPRCRTKPPHTFSSTRRGSSPRVESPVGLNRPATWPVAPRADLGPPFDRDGAWGRAGRTTRGPNGPGRRRPSSVLPVAAPRLALEVRDPHRTLQPSQRPTKPHRTARSRCKSDSRSTGSRVLATNMIATRGPPPDRESRCCREGR